MGLMCITHNIMIVYVGGGFLQSRPIPFSAPLKSVADDGCYTMRDTCSMVIPLRA